MKLNKLQKKIGIIFKDDNLLIQALTHKSFDAKNNYEKLEFLGDRVLGFVISKKLIELYPNEKVGMIDKKLANLVNKNKCFEIGKELELDNYILTGNTEKKKKVNIEKKIISDCCESLIGAIYIDKGFEISSKFILNYWKNYLNLSDITVIDSKTRLQEYSLKKFKALPIYKLVSNTGPRHKPNFKISVKIKNSKTVIADGSSKKNAEQAAAMKLLETIKI
ncbi:ribonuclease III [Candidatus Pelagibacter sp.]|nr:ribonuclease III [Candidatus Pelagibacter sp.]